jgi:hypothetical protein
MLALERREKVGGLGFGALGSVVLVFAIWMMHYSLSSRLSEELVWYLDGITQWNEHYRSDFEALKISVIPYRCIDKHHQFRKTVECLGNIVDLDKKSSEKKSQREVRLQMGLAYRNAAGHIIEKPLD